MIAANTAMSLAYLVIKDGPTFPGIPFGYQDEPVAGEIGKHNYSYCFVLNNYHTPVYILYSLSNWNGRIC